MNKLREKLQSGEKINGTLVCLSDPCLCEIMGNAGYDCVWIDMEHTYISYKEAICHLNASRATDMPAIIRLPQNDLTATKKVLEMGPDGIIFPMAKSVEEVRELIDMTLYPPLGSRGFGPMRAVRYGADSSEDYTKTGQLDMLRFVQIESVELLENIEEAAKIPYIDGFIFGPNDLSGSFGEFLNVYGEKTFSAIKRAADTIKKNGKFVGLAGGFSEDVIKKWSEVNLDMMFAGADWCFIYAQGLETLNNLKKHFN